MPYHGRQRSRISSHESTIFRSRDQDQIQENVEGLLDEHTELEKLGEKFISDKNAIEAEIEKVRRAKISDADKKKLIEDLEALIAAIQEQYEQDVAAEQAKLQEEIGEQTEIMQEVANELDEQSSSFRGVKMDAASTDASAAADTADERKREFEKMKSDSVAKLNAKIWAANIHKQEMFRRRMRGR